jgi:GrpB-like predicted nucleotidyltransferase (UPF0157 family)
MRDRHLIIVDYQDDWPEKFEQERQRLAAATGDYVETIEHIGSTSVPGLAAKPVIDITIGVKNLAIADEKIVPAIVDIGYEYVSKYEDVMPTRRYFRRADDKGMRTHQIHLWAVDDPEYERHIVFRDYLRAHPEEAADYADLKRSLIDKFDDVNDYADAKTEFIRDRENRAYAWRDLQQE